VDKNAQDKMLSGTVVLHPDMTLVIVEGGVKAVRKYVKLMVNRIKWDEPSNDLSGEPRKPNKCDFIWQGNVLKTNFKHFVFEACPTEALARKYLLDHNVGHFWDMAKNYKDPSEI